MRRLLACTLSCLVLGGIMLGCSQPAAKTDDKKIVEVDPKIKVLPPGGDKGKGNGNKKIDEPLIKLVANPADDKQEQYESALADALMALADRKFNDALAAFEAARAIQDTEFVQSEITKLKERIDQDGSAKATVKNIETVLNEGKAEDAVKLTNDAIKEFGDGDDAPKLIQLRLQADALVGVQKNEPNDARYNRFRAEGEAAVREKNLRAAALAYEQALLALDDAELQKAYDELRARLDRYDAQRKKAAELRREPGQLEDAVAALKDASEAWDTQQVRADTDEVMLALAKRRDTVSVADFEVRSDVGMPDAGAALADELFPRLKAKFDLVERSQLKRVIDEQKLEDGFADDPVQQKQIAQLAKVRFLVVGTIRQIGGVTVQARLVDVRTGLVVQTAKIVAANMEDAVNQAPDLAKQLLMNDEEKLAFEAEVRERVAKKVEVVAEDAPLPPAPLPPAADEPPAKFEFNPAPPPLGDFNPKIFAKFEPAPAVLAPPPAEPPPPVVQQRLLFATLEMGDGHFRAGRFREAQRQFDFALTLSPNNFDIRLRLERIRPLLPPPPVVVVVPQQPIFVARPRLAIMPFVNTGNPVLIPPSLSYWTPNNLTPYFASRYDVVDPAEIYWFMGRMGLSLRDVMEDPVARRWLSRATGVRYFVFGSHVETASFDVNTYLIDAEYGYLVGSGRIHVRNRSELRWRLPELASITLMNPRERGIYFDVQPQRDFDRLVQLGRVHMDEHKYALAAADFEEALRLRPYVVQVQFYLSQARDKARWQEFENERQRRFAASQIVIVAQRQRQLELAHAAEAARRRAIAEAAARDEASRRAHIGFRFQAQQSMVTQAQVALKTKNFSVSVNLFQGATTIVPVDAPAATPLPASTYQDFAQARLAAERASRVREAELVAVREATLRQERERQLAAAKQRLADERKKSEEALQAQSDAQLKADSASYKASLAQGMRFMTDAKYEAALAAFQGAGRFAHTVKEREMVNLYIETIVQRQAESNAKTKDEKTEVERRLAVERERRKAAEATAKQNEEKYKLALALAQQALQEKNYDTAQKKYEEAGQLYKTDVVLTGLRQVEAGRSALVAKKKSADAEAKKSERVKQLMNDGNVALEGKKYTEAVAAFQQAKKLAPDNLDVMTGLTRAEQMRAQLQTEANRKAEDAARAQNFQRLLQSGQANLASKQYEAAVASLSEAVKLNPTDAAAQAALKQAEKGRDASVTDAKAAKVRAQTYQKLLNDGQSALASKRYTDAIKAFTEAQKVLPGDKTSKDYLQDAQTAQKAAEDAVAAAAKQRANDLKKSNDLKAALNQGRTALAANDLVKAGKLLNQAKAIDPNDADVVRALRDLDQATQRLTAEAEATKKRQQQFQTLLDTGKTALNGKRYAEAMKALSSATALMPNDKEAQNLFRRAQTEARDAEVATAKAKLNELISTGQAALKAKNYDAAEKALRSASLVEPTNPAIVQGLREVEAGRKSLVADKQRQVDFQLAVGAGQKAMQTKNYAAAIQAYEQALKLMPNEPAALQGLQQARQEQAGLTKTVENFKQAMDTGDKAMTAKNYNAAVKAYTDATKLNPTDALARQRLTQAQTALNAFNEQAALQANYEKALTTGQNAVKLKNYADAVRSFQDALKYAPNDKTASQQLQQAQQLWDASKVKTPPVDPKKTAYDSAVQAGQNALKAKNYAAAVNAFQDALKNAPNDKSASQQLQQAQQLWDASKVKTPPVDPKKTAYDSAVQSGQNALKAKNYPAAVNAFQDALKQMPNDKTASQQLQQAQQLWDASKVKTPPPVDPKKTAYDSAVQAGQNALRAKNYAAAVNAFQDALKNVPNDKSASQQLQQAQQLWDASKVKTPPPADPKKTAYDSAMQQGAALQKDRKYIEAMKAFQEALRHRPKDVDALAGVQTNQYFNHMAVGNQKLAASMWVAAQTEFEAALRLFPNQEDAKKQLEKAKKKMK